MAAMMKFAAPDNLPARYAREFTAIAQAHHYDVDALLDAAGIRAAALDTAAVTFAQCDSLYKLLAQKMDDVCLGVHGHRTPASFVRLFLNYLVQAGTLREALELAIEFFALSDRQMRVGKPDAPLQVAAQLVLAESGQYARFEVYSYRAVPSAVSDLHDGATLQRVLSRLIGVALPLRGVTVMASASGAWESYRAVLDCPIEFDCARNTLVFDAKYLDYPLRQTADSMRAALESRPYELLFPRVATRRMDDVAALVKQAISRDFCSETLTLAAVAKLLGRHPRSLRWELEKAGTSFQQLKNECLRDAAIAYLRRGGLSMAQIAEQLGFADARAFHRSFKRLTGVPPGRYRAELHALDRA